MTGLLPPEWVAQRMQLLRELLATPGLTEAEREGSMADLIRIQRRTSPR